MLFVASLFTLIAILAFRLISIKQQMANDAPKTRSQWQAALKALPDPKESGKIPAWFFNHGSPSYLQPPHLPPRGLGHHFGPNGDQVAFLKDFGPALIEKYKPRAILVFSAHWEEDSPKVTDYGSENPLLYDYYNFDPWYYSNVKFRSKGDSAVSQEVVAAFKEAGLNARTTTAMEPRGRDGRGFMGPGLDHGVFVPFSIMFPGHSVGEKDLIFDIPVIQASISTKMNPVAQEALGAAVSKLRKDGVLILAGGLTVHTFQDFSAFDSESAKPIYKEWCEAITESITRPKTPADRQNALRDLLKHPGCDLAHPRLEHFMPLYVAAGAGNVATEEARVISGLYGAHTIAFGV